MRLTRSGVLVSSSVAALIACLVGVPNAAAKPGDDGLGGSSGTSTHDDGETLTVRAATRMGISPPPRPEQISPPPNKDTGASSSSSAASGPPSARTVGELVAAARDRTETSRQAVRLARLDPIMVPVLMMALRAPGVATNNLVASPSWAGVNQSCSLLGLTGETPTLCKPSPARARTGQGQELAAAQPPPNDPQVVAREAVARMRLPEATAHVGPDPFANEWQMTAVGYPQWLWTDSPAAQQVSVTEQGLTIELNAQRTSTTFDLGDGTKKTCHSMKPWSKAVQPGTPSPVCGHTYEKASLPKGNYEVTATESWEVTWSALGQSGVISTQRSGASFSLPVGQLQALVVAGS